MVLPDWVTRSDTMTAICAGTLPGGEALLPVRDVQVLPQAGGAPVVDEANPLKELGAEPPERRFALAHCAPHQVTDAPTAAFWSPITKALLRTIGVDVGVGVNGTVPDVAVDVGVNGTVPDVAVGVGVNGTVSDVAVEVGVNGTVPGVAVEVGVNGPVPTVVAVDVGVTDSVTVDVGVDVTVGLAGVVS